MNRLTHTLLLSAALGLIGAPGTGLAGPITNRSEALRAVCERLGIGPGAVIADVGCGEGSDAMVFAGIAGERGTVLAEEIDTAKLKKVVETAAQRGLAQVVPILGDSKDPRLPDGFVDLIYLNRVFHHLSYPQAMLGRMWQDLKPGGWLVIVDQHKGPPTDWRPMETREKQHSWTAETTVVRLARESGFLFHDALEDLWHESEPFVLAFRKPQPPGKPAGDPDLPLPLDPAAVVGALPRAVLDGSAALFLGLDRGRAVALALRQRLPPSARLFDVILTEWALSSDELPPDGPLPGSEVLRMEKGRLPLPADSRLDLVLLVDAYHRLWDPVPLLRQLKELMPPAGLLAVVERHGPESESRRLAGHRRRLASRIVLEDMQQAGFRLRQTLPAPAEDRYFLLFDLNLAGRDAEPRSTEKPKS